MDRKFEQLFAVQQQSPAASRIVIEAVAVVVTGNVRIHQKSTALHYIHIRFSDRSCTRPAAFDFSTGKLNTSFQLFQHDIIMQSLAVIGQLTVAGIGFFAVSHLTYNFPRKGPAV